MRLARSKRKLGQFGLTLLGSTAAALGLAALGSHLVHRSIDRLINTLMRDPYRENLWQMYTELMRVGPQNIIDTDLRTRRPQILLRPLGSPTMPSELNRVVFAPIAQLAQLPTMDDVPIRTDVTIGRDCARPLRLEIPVIVGAIDNMFLLNDKARIAMAQGAARAGAGFNPGNAPALPAERRVSRHLIRQCHRGNWMCLDDLRDADAVEILLGEGSGGSAGFSLQGLVEDSARKALRLPEGVPVQERSRFPGFEQASDLTRLVADMRSIAPDVPVGVHIAASQTLEADLGIIIDSGVDFITLSAGDTGSLRGVPILQDDFGIPVLWGLHRARRFLDQHDKDKRIALMVTGGISTPGDFLKCLALGADVICTCTVAFFATMSGQQERVLPGEPPPNMLLRDPRFARRFSITQGSNNVAHWLKATVAEMELGVRNLGKTSLSAVDCTDLAALDKETAMALGIRFVADPVEAMQGSVYSS